MTNEENIGEYTGDPEAIARHAGAYRSAATRAERRRKVWGENGGSSMARLANLFPSVRGVPGTDPFDALALLRWAVSTGASHGEILAAKFLLSVWNPGIDWEKTAREHNLITTGQKFSRFDLFEAMNVWDQIHIKAFLTWIELPFFP